MHALRDMFWAAAAHNCVVRALYMPGHRHVIADCISRLHEPRQFNCLESIINKWYLCHTHKDNDQYSMLSHMSMSSLCTVLKQVQLWRKRDHDWKWTWHDTAKPTNKASCKAQLKTYLQLSHQLSYEPVPASSNTLCQYAAHLALSIRQYLNVVRLLHLESRCRNPLEGNWFLPCIGSRFSSKGPTTDIKMPTLTK